MFTHIKLMQYKEVIHQPLVGDWHGINIGDIVLL